MSELSRAEKSRLQATWDPTLVRHIIVDLDSGNDTNSGIIDAAPGTNLSASAPGLALLTIAKGLSLLPPNGDGRKAEIIIKGRAAGTSNGEDLLLNFSGYRRMVMRGTVTNTTAGCTAWGCTTSDLIFGGFRQVPGTNATGYKVTYSSKNISGMSTGTPVTITSTAHGFSTGDWVYIHGVNASNPESGLGEVCGHQKITVLDVNTFTVDGTVATSGAWVSGGTVQRWKVTTASGGAPGWTDEGTALAVTTLTGKRVRFDGATVTTTWQNAVTNINANGVDTFIPNTAPVAWSTITSSDIFYIEEPNVRVNRLAIQTKVFGGEFPAASSNVPTLDRTYVVGMVAGAITVLNADAVTLAGCEGVTGVNTQIRFQDCRNLTVGSGYQDSATSNGDTGNTVTIGGCRWVLGTLFFRVYNVIVNNLYNISAASTQLDIFNCDNYTISRSVVRGSIFINGSGPVGSYASPTGASINSQVSAIFVPTRVVGNTGGGESVRVIGATVSVFGLEVSDTGTPCIGFYPGQGSRIHLEGFWGSRNNTNVGVGFRSFASSVTDTLVGENTVFAKFVGNNVSARGTLGAIAMAGHPAPNCQSVLDWDDFRSGWVSRIEDVQGNSIRGIISSAGGGTSIRATTDLLAPTIASALAYRVYRLDTSTGDRAVLAKADTAANCAGLVGVSVSRVNNTTGGQGALIVGDGPVPIKFDRSGAHPAPVLGGSVWLSNDTAGLAQADVPLTTGTNQTVYLGQIREISPSDSDTAMVNLRIQIPKDFSGILNTLSVGGAKFTVNATGDLTKVNNITYSWPASQGAASTVLTNNGSGTLTWAAAAGGVTGTGAANRLAYWSGASVLTSDVNFTWDTNNLFVNKPIVLGRTTLPTDTGPQIHVDMANTADFAAAIHMYSPNVVNGRRVVARLGKASTTGNTGEWYWKHVGDNNTGNYMGLGFYAVGTVVHIVQNGNVALGGYLDDGAADGITGATLVALASGRVGINNVAPSQAFDVTGNAVISGTLVAGSIQTSGRIQGSKGTDVASAGTITLGSGGNLCKVTGTGTVDFITTTGWQAGSEITLVCTGASTFNHNTGSVPGSTAAIKLAGSAQLSAAADTVLKLAYDGSFWQEVSRKVA